MRENVWIVMTRRSILVFCVCLLYNSLVFARQDSDSRQTPTVPSVGLTRSDGATRLYVPPPGSSAQNSAFSPDGSRLLFTLFHNGYNTGPAGLHVISVSGGDPVALLDEPEFDSVNLPGSSWSPATRRISFSSDRETTQEIWTMGEDGSDLVRVTQHTAGFFLEPSFSPDGKWIVFEADNEAPDQQQQGRLWKVKADGSGLTQLTGRSSEALDDRQPNWSPVGDRILFQRRSPGSDDWDIFTMAPDGSQVVQITHSISSDTDASWSPDARFIVYSSDFGSLSKPNLFIVPSVAGTPRRLTFESAGEDGAPSWSPDGKWVAFESHQDGNEGSPTSLWKIAIPPQYISFLPHFALIAELWDTEVTLANGTSTTQEARLTVYSDGGTRAAEIEVTLPAEGGISSALGFLFPSLLLESGWIRIESTAEAIADIMKFTFLPTGGTSSLPLVTQTGRRLLFPLLVESKRGTSGFALVNPSQAAQPITLKITNLNGDFSQTVKKTLAPREKLVDLVSSVFQPPLPEKMIMEVSAQNPIMGFALSFDPGYNNIVAVPAFVR